MPRRRLWAGWLVALAVAAQVPVSAQAVGSAVRAPAVAPAEEGAAPGQEGGARLARLPVAPGLRIALAPPAAAQLAVPRAAPGPRRIGVHRPPPAAFQGDLAHRLEWTDIPGGVAGALTVASPGASGIRVALLAQLPPQGQIRFFDPARPERRLPVVTAEDFHVRADGEQAPRWSPVVLGERIGIEVALPSPAARAGFSLRLIKVSHRTAKVGEDGAPCPNHVDVQCRVESFPENHQDAVVRIEFEDDDEGWSAFCTATLVNNQLEDFDPYVLTANHCIDSDAAARSVVTTWFFEHPRCGAADPPAHGVTTVGGASLMVSSSDQDATLLRLARPTPVGAWYSGWDATPVAPHTAVYGIHHPGGDYKKYSAGVTEGHGDFVVEGVAPTLNAIGVEWRDGVTEGGSSGSGLFSGVHLIGVLSGGDDACGDEDWYGNFADFHPKACPWLSPKEACPGRGIPLFLAASGARRQGFARIINRSERDGVVGITAIDDTGARFGPVELALAPLQAAHFNSEDLERGNRAKGLTGRVGAGQGDWRLELKSDLDIEALAYVRTADGFVTTMHEVAPEVSGAALHNYLVPFFNPASNPRQVSRLRLINPGPHVASVSILGRDDRGFAPAPVRLTVAAGTARTVTARQLERGEGMVGALGDRTGKWALTVESDVALAVMNLLDSPTGNLANLSALDTSSPVGEAGVLPLFLAAGNPRRHGFARVSNRTGARGTVTIRAVDERGREFGPAELALGPWQTAHFNSEDLERGNPRKGLAAGVGDGHGDWTLKLETGLESWLALPYVRTADGFVTGMQDVVRRQDGAYSVATFNPASNRDQESSLRLISLGAEPTDVSVLGVDDSGNVEWAVALPPLPALPYSARTVTAQDLEQRDGIGKWRLSVVASRPIGVMSLLLSPTGSLANLSSRTAP